MVARHRGAWIQWCEVRGPSQEPSFIRHGMADKRGPAAPGLPTLPREATFQRLACLARSYASIHERSDGVRERSFR